MKAKYHYHYYYFFFRAVSSEGMKQKLVRVREKLLSDAEAFRCHCKFISLFLCRQA